MLKFRGAAHLSRGIRVGIHAPWVSHLLFADDCLIYSQASHDSAQRLQEILEVYRVGSGQMVNRDKSAIFFSGNCTDEMKLQVHTVLGIAAEALVEKYLGLPTAIGRSTDAEFEHIMSKVKRLVNGGIPRMLSSVGREVYIKSICQAIPTYSMSCFRLSKKFCKKLTGVIARFWWGGDEKKRKMHWRKWEEIAIPKGEGAWGLGTSSSSTNPCLPNMAGGC